MFTTPVLTERTAMAACMTARAREAEAAGSPRSLIGSQLNLIGSGSNPVLKDRVDSD